MSVPALVRVGLPVAALAAVLAVPAWSVREAGRAGSEYGDGRTWRSCVRASLTGPHDCRSWLCGLPHRAFYQACFAAARGDGGLCGDVPSRVNLMGLEAWKNRACRRRDRSDLACKAVQAHAYRACREQRLAAG